MIFRRFLAVAMILGWSALVLAQADSDVKPKRLRISSSVAEKLKTQDVSPTYPEEAKENHIQGDVMLQATIDTEGKVAELKVVTGHPILADAAVKAVKQWRYRPYILDGQPVSVDTTVRIQFRF